MPAAYPPSPRRHGLFAACLLLASSAAWSLPGFDQVRADWRPSDACLLDRNGVSLQTLRLDFQGRRLPWTSLPDLSPALRRAVVTAEDRRFLEHHGVDWLALAGAVLGRGGEGRRRGASTLSMQLAAMLDPTLKPERGRRSLGQKLRQMKAALELERAWSKDQILEAYLNLAWFRGELQGVAAASQVLFGKHASGLAEAEALILAAMLPLPGADAAHLTLRACAIARFAFPPGRCAGLADTAASALRRDATPFTGEDLAPHLARQLLKTPGQSLRTTLDAGLQRRVLEVLREQLGGLSGRNVRDGAALVADNATGDILAYVGSAGPGSRSKVDGVRAQRQAGSTLKPFLYGLAIERRYLTAASLLDDAPLNLETASGLYIPQNYDREFKGLVSVRTALAGSLNIPAIRVLMLTGVERFRDRLRDHGYLSINRSGEYYGYSLALGSAEVSLLEQVAAYRSLAAGGMSAPLRLLPEQAVAPGSRVLSPHAAFVVSDILADAGGRAVTFGLANPLAARFWSAVKTGTSKDMRDNWCIGFSRRYTVGVWVGNFEGDSMHDVSGVSGAAPAWAQIMALLHTPEPGGEPQAPQGVTQRSVRFDQALEPERREWFVAGTEMADVRLADPLTRRPRIASPADGSVIALDPDIPPVNQAIFLAADPRRSGLALEMDGKPLSTADLQLRWQPVPGAHRLTLTDGGKAVDEVRFTVRPLTR